VAQAVPALDLAHQWLQDSDSLRVVALSVGRQSDVEPGEARQVGIPNHAERALGGGQCLGWSASHIQIPRHEARRPGKAPRVAQALGQAFRGLAVLQVPSDPGRGEQGVPQL